MKKILTAIVCAMMSASMTAASYASVMTFGFTNISNNSGVAASVANQLKVDVWSASGANSVAFSQFYQDLGGFNPVSPINIGPAQVLFVFRNNVGLNSSISEIYFADGTILAQHGIYNSVSGYTSYTAGAAPGNLPGGNTVGFFATTAFSADAVGNPNKGVDAANDLAGLSYTLQGGQTYGDTIDSLFDGSLRIGLHLRAIGPHSDSFVNTITAIPEPGSVLVWSILGVAAAGFSNRRRTR